MPSSPPRSTPLENFQVAGDGASLHLDGQRIDLRGDARDPAVGAFQAFYQGALDDYRIRHGAAPRPGLLQRVRSWLARLFGPAPAASAGSPSPQLSPIGPVRSAVLPGPPSSRPPDAVRAEKPAKPPEAKPEVPPASDIRRGRNEALPARRDEPQLRAAYADRGGVHLFWQTGADGESEGKIELIYDLDSPAAQRLQDCYRQLSRLGYKVAGLELFKPEAAPVPKSAPPATPTSPAEERELVAKGGTAPEAGRPPLVEKKERTLVMRLHPAAPEEPNRALVAPVENEENLQVLVAPERLVRALYAAADAGQPADQRVTYLRCALGKSGLKVIDVGIGEGREQGPAKWEDLATWDTAQKAPEPVEKKTRLLPAPQPVKGPELGLF